MISPLCVPTWFSCNMVGWSWALLLQWKGDKFWQIKKILLVFQWGCIGLLCSNNPSKGPGSLWFTAGVVKDAAEKEDQHVFGLSAVQRSYEEAREEIEHLNASNTHLMERLNKEKVRIVIIHSHIVL